jgi:AcrR family transcriptional regulator
LLREVGYGALTFDEVALRSGVHKTTVYRRWPTKPELAAAAILDLGERVVPVPDLGSLTADLVEFGMAAAANIATPDGRRMTRSLVAAAEASEEFSVLMSKFWDARLAGAAVMVERSIERGEIEAIDPRVLLEAFVGAMYFRIVLTAGPIDRDFLEQLASQVV